MKTYIGQSMTTPEFWGCHKNQSLTRGQIRQERRGGTNHAFSGQQLLMLLSVSENLRHKLCRDLPHIQALPYNLLLCSISEVSCASICEQTHLNSIKTSQSIFKGKHSHNRFNKNARVFAWKYYHNLKFQCACVCV